MDSSSGLNTSQPHPKHANEPSMAQSTSSSAVPGLSLFNHANKISMNNTSISATINYNTIGGPSAPLALHPLYQSVAPNAILNAGGRGDEVRCYPGTREEVIGLVEKSIDTNDNSGPRMLWLSGPAGAGKSAIMQTVAERCEELGVPQANFFFFRADLSRRDASGLVATLMHQIIELYPSIGPAVADVLVRNPSLFLTGLQKQFDTLMAEVFPAIQHSLSTCLPLVLLIDGLDECDSESRTAQRKLLQALDTLLLRNGPYFRVVVASRIEPQISMAFKQLRSQVDSIFLDETYSPEKDIRLFVTAEFDKIKSTHYLAHTLSPDWPSASDIDGVVSKSSGQFIFAATVMRFIAHSPASPVLCLQKVQGIIAPNKHTPFAQLDMVYAYILDQVDDPEAVTAIFATVFLGWTHIANLTYILGVYLPRLSAAVMNSCISELTPLINTDGHELKFFHASFPDFLKDQTRAGLHYIDLERFCMSALPSWWADRGPRIEAVYLFTTEVLGHIYKPIPEITAALIQPHPILRAISEDDSVLHGIFRDSISELHRIYSPHDLQSFVQIMQTWLTNDPQLAKHFPTKILKCVTGESKSHNLPIDSQDTFIRKLGMGRLGQRLRHVIGKDKQANQRNEIDKW